jgi:hypothetical protein
LVVNIENSKVMSDMRGKMKVDLKLEIQMPEGENYLVTDSWLVDMTAVSHIQPGESIPVKVDIDDKNKVYPNVEWAGYWLYN